MGCGANPSAASQKDHKEDKPPTWEEFAYMMALRGEKAKLRGKGADVEKEADPKVTKAWVSVKTTIFQRAFQGWDRFRCDLLEAFFGRPDFFFND